MVLGLCSSGNHEVSECAVLHQASTDIVLSVNSLLETGTVCSLIPMAM